MLVREGSFERVPFGIKQPPNAPTMSCTCNGLWSDWSAPVEFTYGDPEIGPIDNLDP